jgi:hypothetical protein
MSVPNAKKTWYSDLPTPTANPADISVSELRALMDDPGLVAGRDYIVVDVRRTDLDVSEAMPCLREWRYTGTDVVQYNNHLTHSGRTRQRGSSCRGESSGPVVSPNASHDILTLARVRVSP